MATTNLDALEAQLRSETFLDRERAAVELAEAGRDGADVLARVAKDVGASSDVRVTALRHLAADDQSTDTLRVLLQDSLPVIRVLALENAERAHATKLIALVEKLTLDLATFWDLDEEIAVGRVAARVLAALNVNL